MIFRVPVLQRFRNWYLSESSVKKIHEKQEALCLTQDLYHLPKFITIYLKCMGLLLASHPRSPFLKPCYSVDY